MANQFSYGKIAIGLCDRCGFQYKVKELRALTIKTKKVNIRVCNSCWEPDQPQLQLGMYPVSDPQAIRNARPDGSYIVSGVQNDGFLGGGNRIFSWGWAPVGGGNSIIDGGTPNPLAIQVQIGTVTVAVT